MVTPQATPQAPHIFIFLFIHYTLDKLEDGVYIILNTNQGGHNDTINETS